MNKLKYMAGVIAALALLMGSIDVGTSGAEPAYEWLLPMAAEAGEEGSNPHLEFGIHTGATDGYDSGIDVPTPPTQPGALFEAYFSIVDTLFPKLNKDLRGEVPNQWTLEVKSTTEDIHLSWSTDDLPAGVALRLVDGDIDIDLTVDSSITLPAGSHTLTLTAVKTELAQYGLSVNSTAGGSVTVPGEGLFSYDEGTQVDLVARADEGLRFLRWTGDVETVANTTAAQTTVTMNSDYSVTATFEERPSVEYVLAVASTEGGSVTDPGEGLFTYDSGIVVDLVARADEGLRFLRWTGDVETVANTTAAQTTVTMNSDYSITATFEERPSVQYAVTVASTEGGSVTDPGEGLFTYDSGTVVDLVAVPDAGYRFVSWTGDVDQIANVDASETNITVEGDYSITAGFEEMLEQYDLAISSSGGGSVAIPGEGTYAYQQGAVVDLMAQAEQGFRFVEWTGQVSAIANASAAQTTVTMDGDYIIMAVFEEIPPPAADRLLIGAILAAVIVGGLIVLLLSRRRTA